MWRRYRGRYSGAENPPAPRVGGFGSPPVIAGSGAVTVDQETFDFGKMDAGESGSHEFVLTNRGDKTHTLNLGSTSCSCTVSEIKDNELAPGNRPKRGHMALQGAFWPLPTERDDHHQ